jgi:aminodeoxyfutalosine synthase
MDSGLKREIEEKVLSGSRLSFDDGVALYGTDEVAWLGDLAHEARTRRFGDRVTFAVGDAELTEVFDQEIRAQITDQREWSRIHRLVHADGRRTSAVMLYGHVEEPAHRVEHVLRLREQQDDTGVFQVFVPLRHQPDTDRPAATGVESLKVFAVSRLLLDNVEHVSCSLAAHGLSTSQLALNYGADDLLASVDAAHDDLVELIGDAGFPPAERNSRFEVVKEYAGPDPLRREEPQLMTF